MGGDFNTVGSFGKVIRGSGSGLEAEIRADAALAFGSEHDQYRRHVERGGRGKYRVRNRKAPTIAGGFAVRSRALLADPDGHVRLELILSDEDGDARPIAERLEDILTSPVHVVREGPAELISAGFSVARLYLEQSAKTASDRSAAVTVQLLREGAGSPFLILLHPEPRPPGNGGIVLDPGPGRFQSASCELLELAGRSTGVWHIHGCGDDLGWVPEARTLCRIVCQLSEVTSLAHLQQDSAALAPHLLDPMLTERFFRLRAGQLRRTRQGVWPVGAVQPLAAQHLEVAVEEAVRSTPALTSIVKRDVANDIGASLARIRDEMVEKPMISQSDRTRLARLLATEALTQDNFFARLVRQAALPQEFRFQLQRWSADPRLAALELIDWAVGKGTNPSEPKRSTLASILLPELGNLGLEGSATIVAVLMTNRLLYDEAEISSLQVRYQIPVAMPAGEAAAVGPDFAWRGPAEDLELQSWLRPDPPLLEVGYLIEAIAKATSVCLVKVGATGKTGTGVLVHPRYVLTNYHVIEELMQANGPAPEMQTVTLGFGSFSEGSECETFPLDAASPVAEWSPTHELDFALLRVSADIDKAVRVRPAALATGIPGVRAGLSILQHPNGGSMKLSPSYNTVTFVDPANGIVQYVAETAGGSSGAPCFDEQWKVIALHHAQRTRTFGSVREGILIARIRERIARHIA